MNTDDEKALKQAIVATFRGVKPAKAAKDWQVPIDRLEAALSKGTGHSEAGSDRDTTRPPIRGKDAEQRRPDRTTVDRDRAQDVTKEEETTGPPAADPVMYRGVVGDIVAAATPTTEADPVGIFVSLLAAVGVAIGPGPFVQVGNTRHPLLVWPLLFGSTGSGRKGEATNTASLFVGQALPWFSAFIAGGLSSGEGLIERVRDVADEDDSGGTEDKRLLVIEPEFASVMARSRREGNTLAAVLRQAWDGGALSVLNKTAVRASSSHIAIIGHITPREFRLRLAETELTGGTYNRFFPFFVDRNGKIPLPPGVADKVLAKHAGQLAKSIEQARKVGRVQLDPGATKLWQNTLYDEFTASDDDDLSWTEFTRRAAPYCLRIGAVHAVMEGQNLISAEDLAAAAALVRYSVASAKYVLDRRLRDPRMDRVRRAIDQAGPRGLGRTEISDLFSRNVAKKVLDEILADLTTAGGYEEFQAPTSGRPATRYRRVVAG